MQCQNLLEYIIKSLKEYQLMGKINNGLNATKTQTFGFSCRQKIEAMTDE